MKQIKNITRVIVFLAILILIIELVTPIFIPKWVSGTKEGYSYIRKGFYNEDKNTIDVFFVGNSNVYRGVTPMLLWEKSGITSYDVAGSMQKMWNDYYMIKDAINYQKPKIIVLDLDAIFDDTPSQEEMARKYFDTMKLSNTKIEAISDPVFEFSTDVKLTYLFPILRYHSRWSEFNDNDFYLAYDSYHYYNKGFDMSGNVKFVKNKYNNYNNNDSKENNNTNNNNNNKENNNTNNKNKDTQNNQEKIKIPSKCEKYIDKIIELCKENDIEIIFISLPNEYCSEEKNTITTQFAKEKGIEYINLNEKIDEIKLNWNEDRSDEFHLNIYGAEKVTNYLNNYFEKYQLEDHRNDVKYRQWNLDLKEYQQNVNKKKQTQVKK